MLKKIVYLCLNSESSHLVVAQKQLDYSLRISSNGCMKNSLIEEQVKSKFISLRPLMNEYLRRRWAAVEASTIGYGGISMVARATGLSRNTIVKGITELSENTDEIPVSTLTLIRRQLWDANDSRSVILNF